MDEATGAVVTEGNTAAAVEGSDSSTMRGPTVAVTGCGSGRGLLLLWLTLDRSDAELELESSPLPPSSKLPCTTPPLSPDAPSAATLPLLLAFSSLSSRANLTRRCEATGSL